jgi:glutaredoxin
MAFTNMEPISRAIGSGHGTLRHRIAMKPIGILLLAATFTLSAHAQNWGGLVKNVLSGRAPSAQDVMGTLRSLTDVSFGQITGGVRSPAAADGQVVLYRTSWCGYCRQAASYMQQKGIAYVERDIETSAENKAEYRQLGGTGGVPMLVFGQKTMMGFSPANFDAAYAQFRQADSQIQQVAVVPSAVPYVTSHFPPEAGDVLVGKIANISVYEQANKSSSVITVLRKTDEVVYMGEEREGLYRVTTADGTGWADKLMLKKR